MRGRILFLADQGYRTSQAATLNQYWAMVEWWEKLRKLKEEYVPMSLRVA
jgi:hypothetical protein